MDLPGQRSRTRGGGLAGLKRAGFQAFFTRQHKGAHQNITDRSNDSDRYPLVFADLHEFISFHLNACSGTPDSMYFILTDFKRDFVNKPAENYKGNTNKLYSRFECLEYDNTFACFCTVKTQLGNT